MRLCVFAALVLTASAAGATDYNESIPAMGPALYPGPGRVVMRQRIVEHSGPVTFISRYWGQNWRCLGDDGDQRNRDNYPIIGLYDLGRLPQGLHSGSASPLADLPAPIAEVRVADPDDYPVCAVNAGECYRGNFSLDRTAGMQVNRGDVLVWVVIRDGSNCPGAWYVEHGGNPPYPTAPGGEIMLGIHVHD